MNPPEEATPNTPITAVMQLISEQAEDDGLWFVAQTAPEAYLQQELRRLHTAIELHYRFIKDKP